MPVTSTNNPVPITSPEWLLSLPLWEGDCFQGCGCRNGQRGLVSEHNLLILGARLGKFPGALPLAESRGSPGSEFGSLPPVPSPVSSCTPGAALQGPLIGCLASKASVWFPSPTALPLPGALFPTPWKNTIFSKVTGQLNTKK